MNLMRRLKTALALALAALMIVPLAACGTTDATDSDPDIARSYNVDGIQKDDTIAAMLPESVTDDGKFTVGVNITYAPAEFLAADGKTPVGYEIDLDKALAKVFGLDLDIQNSTFDTIIPAVGSKYDVGISGFTVNKERIEAVDFVTYAQAGLTFAARKGNPTHVNVNDLCGTRVSVQVGVVAETEMYKMQDACQAAGKKRIEILPYRNQTDVTTALIAGRVDLMYADTPVTGYAVAQTGDRLQVIGENEGVAPMGVAIKKGDTATVKAVKAALDKLRQTGDYERIMKAWGVENVMVDKFEVNPKVES
ncbi:ABC transporter substrate-binding protein [Bifidobacterium callimiconis]|uniref:ABC transporter substrate-binding protein n=1 Tax=Bifidobacterium callimiconis TaxID=2306973 RepID=UPI001BDBD584|nr:ABC transporter substrate-binding protein [Bifidobacterium callimiconis]MBT1177515.1 ABC transporter substrate-binding protein [Bifidobacterium callimiconis]